MLSYDIHGTTLEIVCQYKSFEDVVLDLAWNPKSSITDANSSQQIVTSCGDGKVSLMHFDYLFNCLHPVKTIQAHRKEVASIEWCNDFILTSSWDLSSNVSVVSVIDLHQKKTIHFLNDFFSFCRYSGITI